MLIVGSLNVQNKFWISHYNGNTKEQNSSLLLKHFLYKYHVDILGTQEFVPWYLEEAKKTLKDYSMVGSFRYKIPFIKKYNETNSIITKKKIINHKTFYLTKVPIIPPRIITEAKIETTEFGKITFLNTHLTLGNKRIQKKELNKIIELVKNSKYPIILTGDFNMTIHNSLMKNFMEELKKQHLVRVPIMEKTYKRHKKENAIDHIFLSQTFTIQKYKVIKDSELDHFSDHYPILVWLTKKEH